MEVHVSRVASHRSLCAGLGVLSTVTSSWLTAPSSWLAAPSSWLAGTSSWLAGTSSWLTGASVRRLVASSAY